MLKRVMWLPYADSAGPAEVLEGNNARTRRSSRYGRLSMRGSIGATRAMRFGGGSCGDGTGITGQPARGAMPRSVHGA